MKQIGPGTWKLVKRSKLENQNLKNSKFWKILKFDCKSGLYTFQNPQFGEKMKQIGQGTWKLGKRLKLENKIQNFGKF